MELGISRWPSIRTFVPEGLQKERQPQQQDQIRELSLEPVIGEAEAKHGLITDCRFRHITPDCDVHWEFYIAKSVTIAAQKGVLL